MNSNQKRNLRASRDRVKPAVLSEPLHRRLNAYALAAGVAGVATLACAPQAEAAPVCQSFPVRILGTNTVSFNPAGEDFAPFRIAQTTFGYYSSDYVRLFSWKRGFFTPNSQGANLVLAKNNFPANVASGASIGPGGQFGKGESYGLLFTYGVGSPGNRHHGTVLEHQGNLNLQGTNYVGVQFSRGGQVHYGWARLQVTVEAADVGKTTIIDVLGWGYESTPNVAIAAGQCADGAQVGNGEPTAETSSLSSASATLGVLALGNVDRVK